MSTLLTIFFTLALIFAPTATTATSFSSTLADSTVDAMEKIQTTLASIMYPSFSSHFSSFSPFLVALLQIRWRTLSDGTASLNLNFCLSRRCPSWNLFWTFWDTMAFLLRPFLLNGNEIRWRLKSFTSLSPRSLSSRSRLWSNSSFGLGRLFSKSKIFLNATSIPSSAICRLSQVKLSKRLARRNFQVGSSWPKWNAKEKKKKKKNDFDLPHLKIEKKWQRKKKLEKNGKGKKILLWRKTIINHFLGVCDFGRAGECRFSRITRD